MTNLRVLSFGYGHGDLPDEVKRADITVDVRDWFRDPHVDPSLREMTGLDRAVIDKVLATWGVTRFIATLGHLAVNLMRQRKRTVIVAVGCVGGRHRSVVIAAEVVRYCARYGYRTEVEHLHVDRPVIRRAITGEREGPN